MSEILNAFNIVDKILEYKTNWFNLVKIMDKTKWNAERFFNSTYQKVGEEDLDHVNDGRTILGLR